MRKNSVNSYEVVQCKKASVDTIRPKLVSKISCLSRLFFCLVLLSVTALPIAAQREIQLRSISFSSAQIELFNFGEQSQSLDGFRFCSSDEDEVRKYTNANGLNGKSIPAKQALFIHFNNDAPAGDPQRINRSSLGGSLATPLDTSGAYGLSLYYPPVDFADGATMADHLQWSFLGLDDASADERADEAEAIGLWAQQGQWIATNALTAKIVLIDSSGSLLHSPSNYIVAGPAKPIPVILGTSLIPSATPETILGNFTISWVSNPGATFVVEASDDLKFWSIIAPAHTASGTATPFTVANIPADAPPRFFRIWEK